MANYIRNNAWNNNGDFSNTDLLWYAKGVGEMQKRALDDPSSWWFFGAIHGEYVTPESLQNPRAFPWSRIPGPPAVPVTPLPSKKVYGEFWNQCQHGSWYFLPWHRGYLLALEAQIRAEVIRLGGPATWALPYWNYFGPNAEYNIPTAFTDATLPDGSDNPLFMTARYGPTDSAVQAGNIWVATADGLQNHPPLRPELSYGPVTLDSMKPGVFAGDTLVPEFGGPQTGFSHSGKKHGNLEANPHDFVHVYTGGGSPDGTIPGLMSVPALAALDPVFYLHHANIDRLWAVWNAAKVQPPNVNPTDPTWLNGPAASGGGKFVMPWPGTAPRVYTPSDMTSLAQLNYTYDDLSQPAAAASALVQRLTMLGAPRVGMVADSVAGQTVELVGASPKPLTIRGTGAHTTVTLQPEVRKRMTASLTAASETAPPDRVFLDLDNVRGADDAHVLSVFINLPAGEKPGDHPELLAGSVALFGLSDASFDGGGHGGEGLSFALDISKTIDALHLNNALDTNSIGVTIVPHKAVTDDAQITIGQISIFRKGR